MATIAKRSQVYVQVSALDAGQLTLPERLFVTDADPTRRITVPSLSFLIQHPSPPASPDNPDTTTRLIFDLGIKRDLTGYTTAQQEHIAQRMPVIASPDCTESLRTGAHRDSIGSGKRTLLEPANDIDMVILSHVHWDHVGTPSDFPNSIFFVGAGTLDLLRNGAGPLYPADLFNDDELPTSRTVEFPPVTTAGESGYYDGPNVPTYTPSLPGIIAKQPAAADKWQWEPLSGFPNALDFFGDGSMYIIDSPGHLYGHVNLLARVSKHKYVYLGGDCCHDPRILSGEKGIAMYEDGRGGLRSVHVDTGIARRSLDTIGQFIQEKSDGREVEVEVIVAHDKIWMERNRHRFWPGIL